MSSGVSSLRTHQLYERTIGPYPENRTQRRKLIRFPGATSTPIGMRWRSHGESNPDLILDRDTCTNRYTMRPLARRGGFEPPTKRLTAVRSATELPPNGSIERLRTPTLCEHLVNSQACLPISPRWNEMERTSGIEPVSSIALQAMPSPSGSVRNEMVRMVGFEPTFSAVRVRRIIQAFPHPDVVGMGRIELPLFLAPNQAPYH